MGVGFHVFTSGGCNHPAPGIRSLIPKDRRSGVISTNYSDISRKRLGHFIRNNSSLSHTLVVCMHASTDTIKQSKAPTNAYCTHSHIHIQYMHAAGMALLIWICNVAHCLCSAPQGLAGKCSASHIVRHISSSEICFTSHFYKEKSNFLHFDLLGIDANVHVMGGDCRKCKKWKIKENGVYLFFPFTPANTFHS